MSDYDKEIEANFDMSIDNNKLLQEAYDRAVEYVEFNKKNLLTNSGTEIDFKVGYSMGYRSGAKFQKEKDVELIESVYPVPCDCHLFKEQVCDFCQGIVKYIRLKTKDKEASEG
jgi:hypothetical protein